jgi:hypothetical protein
VQEAARNRTHKSKTALQLERAKVQDRLRELRDNDPDPSVRLEAAVALERFTKVPHKEGNGR